MKNNKRQVDSTRFLGYTFLMILNTLSRKHMQKKIKDGTEISISLDPSSGSNLEQYVTYLNDIPDIAIHLDVMDGVFVPRISIPKEEYDFTIKNTEHMVDVHLMITSPQNKINPYIAKAVWGTLRSVTFQIEALDTENGQGICMQTTLALLNKIKSMNIQAGIAIDLPTTVESIESEILNNCDVVTIMSVKCGASGQSFNKSALDKVIYMKKHYPKIRIILDGGINADNLPIVKSVGTDTAVFGSHVYKAQNKAESIANLKVLC